MPGRRTRTDGDEHKILALRDAQHDFATSGWISLAGNALAIILGSVALARAPRGSGARAMGIVGLVLGLVGLLGSMGLLVLAAIK